MESRKIKLFVLFVITLFLPSVALSQDESNIPIDIYNNDPITDGSRRPHRAPRKTNMSLNIWYDTNINQLVFFDYLKQDYYYMVIGDDNNVLSEGCLEFDNQDFIYVDLEIETNAIYTIVIFYEDNEYTGTLLIK